MPDDSASSLPFAQLAEFTSSLENCEWALTRAREALTSMVVGLKEHLRGSALHRLIGAQAVVEASAVAKIEPVSDGVDTVSAVMAGQNNESERDPVPSVRIQASLQKDGDKYRDYPAVRPNDYLEATQLATVLTTQPVPLERAFERTKKKRTEQQRAARREKKRRASAKRRSKKLAELMENHEVPRGPHPVVPSEQPSAIGTAANSAPLPFNRMSMPPPPIANTNFVSSRAWSNGLIGPVYPAGYMREHIHPFAPGQQTPEFHTDNQQTLFFHSTVQPFQDFSHAPNFGECYELEEGEIQ